MEDRLQIALSILTEITDEEVISSDEYDNAIQALVELKEKFTED